MKPLFVFLKKVGLGVDINYMGKIDMEMQPIDLKISS